jgi:hypothetical protein
MAGTLAWNNMDIAAHPQPEADTKD